MKVEQGPRIVFTRSMIKNASKDIRPGDRVKVRDCHGGKRPAFVTGLVIDRYNSGFLVLTDKDYKVYVKYIDYLMGDGVWKI